MLPSGIISTVLSFSPQMKPTQLLDFLLLPKNSTYKLKAVACLLCLNSFLWFLFNSHFSLLLFPLLTSLSNTEPEPTLALPLMTFDPSWLPGYTHTSHSLLSSQVSPSIISHGNTSSLDEFLLSFYLFSLTVCFMTVPCLTLVQTAKQFSPSSPSPNRDVLFLLSLPIKVFSH